LNEYVYIMAGVIAFFMFIGIFAKGVLQWVFAFAIVILGTGICFMLASMTVVPVWLLLGVVVVVGGYVTVIISLSLHNA